MKNKIKELRLEAGYTQKQLADLALVSSRTIISLETGQYNPSLLLAYRLCLEENLKEEDQKYEKL